MTALFHPRSAPLELTGASRVVVEISSHHSRTAKLTFPCSRNDLAGYAQSNFAKALEAFKFAISFRRSLINHAHIKAWSKRHGIPNFPASGA